MRRLASILAVCNTFLISSVLAYFLTAQFLIFLNTFPTHKQEPAQTPAVSFISTQPPRVVKVENLLPKWRPQAALTRAYKKPLPQVSSPEAAAAILDKIAECESNDNPYAKNPDSTAKGLLQILDSTWDAFSCQGNVYNAADNMRCGIKIATESGLQHWNQSRTCWQKLVS